MWLNVLLVTVGAVTATLYLREKIKQTRLRPGKAHIVAGI